jgi:putative aldouronate transport system permease protein
MPTFVILLLLQLGLIMKGNFGQVYALVGMNSALYSKVDVLDTFVYRGAFLKGDFSYPAAIGLYQAVVGMILVLSTNYYAKRKSYATIF